MICMCTCCCRAPWSIGSFMHVMCTVLTVHHCFHLYACRHHWDSFISWFWLFFRVSHRCEASGPCGDFGTDITTARWDMQSFNQANIFARHSQTHEHAKPLWVVSARCGSGSQTVQYCYHDLQIWQYIFHKLFVHVCPANSPPGAQTSSCNVLYISRSMCVMSTT